jgi:hypothetical protein
MDTAQCFTVSQAALFLRCPVQTLYSRLRRGTLPGAAKLGRAWLLPAAWVRERGSPRNSDMTPAEVAAALGLKLRTIYSHLRRGTLFPHAYQRFGEYFIPPADVSAAQQRRKSGRPTKNERNSQHQA